MKKAAVSRRTALTSQKVRRRRSKVEGKSSLTADWRKKGKRLLRGLRTLAVFLLFSAVGYYFFGASGYFCCQQLTINSLDRISEQEVMAVLPPILGKNLLLLPLADIQERVESLKLVERAAVNRVFPGVLKIWIKERQPLAVAVVANETWAVDRLGVVLYPFEPAQIEDPVFITGLSADDEDNGIKIKLAVNLINRMKRFPRSFETVSEVNVKNRAALKLYAFEKGVEIRLNRTYREQHKWNYLMRFLERSSFDTQKLAYLDLRFEKIVVRPL